MRTIYTAIALGGVIALASYPAQAKAPKESYCSVIEETEDGKFTYQMKTGWSLYYAQKEDGEISYASNVAGVACLRAPVTLVAEDAETLRQGKSLYFSDPKSGATINYKVVDGAITYEVTTGSLSKSQIKKVTKAVAKVQALL